MLLQTTINIGLQQLFNTNSISRYAANIFTILSRTAGKSKMEKSPRRLQKVDQKVSPYRPTLSMAVF